MKITDIAKEKHKTVIIVYKFQSIPDFSDCTAHAIPFIKKERPLYQIDERINTFLLVFKNLIFLSFNMTVIELIRKMAANTRAIAPKPRRDFTPIITAHKVFQINVMGANIKQVKEIISLKEFFFIIFSLKMLVHYCLQASYFIKNNIKNGFFQVILIKS